MSALTDEEQSLLQRDRAEHPGDANVGDNFANK